MICPACRHTCDEDETCANCNRPYAVSLQLVRDRRRYLYVLLTCHIPWLILVTTVPLAFIASIGGHAETLTKLFGLVALEVLGPICVAVIGGALLIDLIVSLILCQIEASKIARDLWSILVGTSSVGFIVFLLMGFL